MFFRESFRPNSLSWSPNDRLSDGLPLEHTQYNPIYLYHIILVYFQNEAYRQMKRPPVLQNLTQQNHSTIRNSPVAKSSNIS